MTERGGYSIYRLFLHDVGKKEEAIRKLLDLDTLIEQDGKLIAIAVSSTGEVDRVVEYILMGKEKGFWGAQDGYVYEP